MSDPHQIRDSFIVVLNGTDRNPYQSLGLDKNPFPAIPKHERGMDSATLADLAAEPIENEADLRRRLRGWSPEFVELCVRMFQPGRIVRFRVSYPA